MLNTTLDHLVIAAANLEEGKDYIISKLGIEPIPGGQHPQQGTHNSLVNLGTDTYLEIIAINPDGANPDRPRWFNLDDPTLQKKIAEEPKLITWVARTSNIKQALLQASYDPGEPKTASRGSLEWSFTFTKDGALMENGLLPPLIEWKTSDHPSILLPDSIISLKKFEAFHPAPGAIQNHLKSLELHDILKVQSGDDTMIRLRATFDTPAGEVEVNSL